MRCKIAIDAAMQVGLPEAVIPLSNTVIELALSPKSKAAELSMGRAMDLVKDKPLEVLDYLKLTPVNVDEIDKYPYDRPDLWEKMQYLPDLIKNEHFYVPENKSQLIMRNYQKLIAHLI